MKKSVIYVLSGLVVLVVMIVAAAVIVLNLDPNRYKDYIAGKVSQQMGRTFEIRGDLTIGYFPWLHVETSGIFLENAPGFGDLPLLAADHVMVRVKTLPLLRKQLEVDTIVLKGARVNLAKNKAGVSNWEGLGGPSGAGGGDKPPDIPSDKSSDKGFDMANLAVLLKGGVDIQDAAFGFDDQAAGKKYTVSGLNITTGMVVPGDPVDLSLSFTAAATAPEIFADAALEGKIFYDFDTGQYQIQPFAANAQLSGPALGKTPAKLNLTCVMELDLAKDTLSVRNLQANGLDTRVGGNIFLGGMESGVSRADMDLDVAGKDLARLFAVFEGGSLSTQLAALPDRSFDFKTKISADTDKGMVQVPKLAVHMLGADITGTFKAEDIYSAAPTFTGDVAAAGPDLPLLLELAGTVQRNDFLADMGRRLAASRAGQKKFHADVTMDVDMGQGRVLVKNLDMAGLGVTVKADVTARHLGSKEAVLDGGVALDGRQLARLLTALDQPDLAAVLDTVAVKGRFKGNYKNLALDPMQVRFGFAGPQIPNPPVFVTLDVPVHLQLEKQILDLASFSIKGLDLDVSGSLTAKQIQTSPEYTGNISLARFNLRQLMKKLNQPLPQTSDARVFEKVALKTQFSGTAADIRLNDLSVTLDDSQMKGNLAIQGFSDPDITCDLAVDKINADRYMPPAAKEASGKKQAASPVTPETAAAGAAVLIPVELLRDLKLTATLAIEHLIVSGAVLSRVRVHVTAKDGIITKAPMTAGLYKGTYDGKVVLDATGDVPKLAIDTTLKGVEVEPLLMDMTQNALVRGTGDVTASLTTRGGDVEAMKRNLNGSLSFVFKNGAIKGFNAGKFLRSLKSLRESRTLAVSEQEETDFTELTGNPVVKNGVVFLDDLAGKSPALRISGTGIVADIVRETIDYKAMVTVVETSRGQTGSDLAELAGLTVPVSVKGPLADPVITPDITGVISKILTGTSSEPVEQLKKSVEKELGRFLKKFSE
ncbi:MAG: AsmA family protein [Desulfotignum sp.]|nr:AsmA family protein [Desulfotignum sp.]MCF8126468.1 AsmA family protein [Desulfotignum sp.]